MNCQSACFLLVENYCHLLLLEVIVYLFWTFIYSWDEWMEADRLLKFTDENVHKQKELEKEQSAEKIFKSGRPIHYKPKNSNGLFNSLVSYLNWHWYCVARDTHCSKPQFSFALGVVASSDKLSEYSDYSFETWNINIFT